LEDQGDFSHIDARDLQFMAVLDIRLCNVDRHLGNILVNYTDRSSKWEITAIDHGYCLPDFSGLCDVHFDWARWPQAQAPVHPVVAGYITQLNADDDLDLLMRRVPEICALRRAECLLSMRITSMLLQMCVARNKTLSFVAELFRAPPRNCNMNEDAGNSWRTRRVSPLLLLIILFCDGDRVAGVSLSGPLSRPS
jgi:hypothetical protein